MSDPMAGAPRSYAPTAARISATSSRVRALHRKTPATASTPSRWSLFRRNEAKLGRAIFAAGCFWGVEHCFKEQVGVVRTTVGYTGGWKKTPTYEEVCSGQTGHLEAVEVLYDPARLTYEALAKLFFEIHDPTQVDGQGPDIGSRCRSAIFYEDNRRSKSPEAHPGAGGEGLGWRRGCFQPPASGQPREYHQDYYEKKGSAPYCHFRQPRW